MGPSENRVADDTVEQALSTAIASSSSSLNDNEVAVLPGESLAAFCTRVGKSVSHVRDLNRQHISESGDIQHDRLKVSED